jgi:D-alanyl-D-alanine carboxypeptidase
MTYRSIAIADERGDFLLAVDMELPIYSLAKPLIASTVFSCGIDISTPIARWIESDLVPRADEISVNQLLNHTSGLRDYGGLSEYVHAVESGDPPWSDDVYANHTLRKPLLFEPGEGWAYSNPGYWLLTQIVQIHTGIGFDEALRKFISDPLGLAATKVTHGQFADDLPAYPAEWVWHGLVTSTASDVVRFMRSPLVGPLRAHLSKVPFEHPLWVDAHYGYGLMVDPGVRYGHNGEGPKYSASCYHFIETGLTGCVLTQADGEEEAMQELLVEIAKLR